MDNSIIDHAGRIPKQAFIVSIIFFLATSIVAAAARFFIRIHYQHQVSVDDGFLLFGICCMICSVAVIFVYIDSLYLLESIEFGSNVDIPPNFIDQAWKVQKFSAISLTLCWFSIVSVKFSFLFLFRKLVDRVRVMKIYWWVVTIFNAVISCYGVSVYYIACPKFYTISDLKCGSGAAAWRATQYSISQIVLDIVGDLLILYIPIHLILRIQIRWTQKLALLSSLCLTLVIIILAITKASGIRHGTDLDEIWEIYFQTISAEVGLIMTAVTAFRAFFVAKSHERPSGSSAASEPSKFRIFNPKFWLRKSSLRANSNEIDEHSPFELKDMPGTNSTGTNSTGTKLTGTKSTGISTLVEGSVNRDEERSKGIGSRLGMRSEPKVGEEREDDLWPLHTHEQGARSIMVKKDVSFFSERNSSSSEYIYGNVV